MKHCIEKSGRHSDSAKSDVTCTNCGRRICPWHSALSPVSLEGEVVLVPVCLPQCDSKWWEAR